jgi:hypothetical protein
MKLQPLPPMDQPPLGMDQPPQQAAPQPKSPWSEITLKQQVPLAPEELDIEKEQEKLYLEGVAQRQGQMGKDQASYDQLQEPTFMEKADFRPMAALLDQYNGTNLAQSFSANTAAKDHEAKKQLLQKALEGSREGVSKDRLEYLKLLDMRKKNEELLKWKQLNANTRGEGRDESQEFRLREKYEANPTTKASQSMGDHYTRITAVDPTSNAGQMSMIFSFMKMLDDGSVVRESEYAQAARTAGLMDRAQKEYENLSRNKATILTPAQIKDFLGTAESIMQEVRNKQSALDDDTRNLASSYGLNADRVVYRKGMLPEKRVQSGKSRLEELRAKAGKKS